MSLINDALKKAQRQRTGEQAPLPVLPSAGGESMEPRVVKRAKPAGFNAQMIRLGAIIGGAVIVVGGLLMWSFSKPTTSPSIQTKISQPVQATTPSSATPTATGNSTAAATTPVTTFTLNIPEPSPVKPEPVQQEPVRQSPPVEKKSAPVEVPVKKVEKPVQVAEAPVKPADPPAKPAPVVVAEKPKPDPRVLAFIDALRVTGIRAAGADSKVLMNDRVYRINDVVERESGLKLVGVAVGTLSFEDAQGAIYTRNF